MDISKFPPNVMQPGELSAEQLAELTKMIKGNTWNKVFFKFGKNDAEAQSEFEAKLNVETSANKSE